MIDDLNKIFFTPGDVVTIKHSLLTNKPVMLVKGKESRVFKNEKEGGSSHFMGIRCFWFTSEGLYQEQVFSTKDLVHVED